MSSITNTISNLIEQLKYYLIGLLPDSPFQMIAKSEWLNRVLGYVNYFVPIDLMLKTLALWLAAVLAYYLIMVALRWLKVLSS